MSLTTQTQAVKDAIALLGTKIREISLKADNAPNAQLLEGYTVQGIQDLITGTSNSTIEDVEAALQAFIARRDNPHQVTQEQVGLGLVDNFASATEAEAIGTVFDYTATAGQTVLSGADDNTATMDLSQAPGVYVTKNTGDRLVEGTDYTINYTTSEITLTAAAAAGDVYHVRSVVADRFIVSNVMWSVLEQFWGDKLGSTPDALNTIQELAAALENNPDVIQNLTDQIATKATQSDIDTSISALTKADIGLGNVQDYSVATEQEAIDGLVDTKYMTPAKTKAHTDNVAAGLQTQINSKTAQTDHDALQVQVDSLTKADIGLGNVDNYATATNAQAEAGTATNLFMTPASTKAATDALKALLQGQIVLKADQTALDSLQTAFDNRTKADIGLGSVENYGIATEAQALETDPVLSSNQAYMTPARTLAVRQAIESAVEQSLVDIEAAFNAAIAEIDGTAT